MVRAAPSRTIFALQAGDCTGRARSYVSPHRSGSSRLRRQWQRRHFLAPAESAAGLKQRHATTAAPISTDEFYQALKETWGSRSIHDHGNTDRTLGIAVSGGVDSMALATLCQALAKARPQYRLLFKAYIVDHAARAESAREASTVAGLLQDFGLSCTVTRVEWPDGMEPLSMGSFETLAREARFRALGKACLRDGVTSLFLAHHADDQAETILARLSHGHGVAGLRGLRPSSGIPGNFGVYGVYRSGMPRSGLGQGSTRGRGMPGVRSPPMLKVESGGVKVFRPLLMFPKARLVATCLKHERAWVEDPTNHDVTLTARNAIRHLLVGKRLPKALRAPSLLALSQRIHQRRSEIETKMDDLMDICRVRLDTRVGSVRLHLPVHAQVRLGSSLGRRQDEEGRVMDRGSIAEHFLTRVIAMVSPSEEPVRRSMVVALVKELFPDFTEKYDGGIHTPRRKDPSHGITIGSVIFRQKRKRAFDDETGRAMVETGLDTEHVWLVSRQPCRDAEMRHSPVLFPATLGRDGDGDREPDREPDRDAPWSAWQLWDGRFWIRVRNRSRHDVVARAFDRRDFEHVRDSVSKARWAFLRAFLKGTQPDGLRWTMPVLSFPSGPPLALPSIGFCDKHREFDGKVGRGADAASEIAWEIRYKSIEPL